MSRKIYNKNLTFLKDQPFAENLLAGFSYKKRKAKLFSRRDSFLARQSLNNNIKSSIGTDTFPSSLYPAKQVNNQSTNSSKAIVGVSFGYTPKRNKSEKMKKAEASLTKHFCLILERFSCNEEHTSLYTRAFEQRLEWSNELQDGNIIPHLLVSIDSMQNTLLATRGSRYTERIKPPSHFKKILRESRKIRLLYGNLSRRQLFRDASRMRLPGENLLIWLESRLDVVLERCGFFGSIKAARQFVYRGYIAVNSKVVKSPGFILKGGDFIRIVQKELLLNPLVGQLSRGAILSTEVSPHILRKKKIAIAFSNILQKSKTTSFLKHAEPFNKGFNNIVDKNFDPFCPRSSRSGEARELYHSKSFYTWLLRKKQRNFESNKHLAAASPLLSRSPLRGDSSGDRDSNALLVSELQLIKLSAQDTIDLNKKIYAPNNWRFRGSPHLLFSFFFLHGYLQKIISSIAHTCNKKVSIDKRVVKLFSYKTQKWNNISIGGAERTSSYSNPSSFAIYRTHFNFPTIFFTSKHCVISASASNIASSLNHPYKREGLLIDTLNIELFFNLSRQFLQKIKKDEGFVPKIGQTSFSQSDILTNARGFLGERLVHVLPELYNNLFPWFICSNQANVCSASQSKQNRARFLKEKQGEALYGFGLERETLSQVVSGIIREDEKSLLSVLLSNLLLYSLLIKKELASLRRRDCAYLEKKKIDKKKAVSLVSSAGATSSKKQPTFDITNKINPKVGCFDKLVKKSTQITDKKLDLKLKVKSKDKFKVGYSFTPTLSGSRTAVNNLCLPKAAGYKEIYLNQRFNSKSIKPLHLEISYQSLCAVYLFPPQRVCLPIMVDLDCLAKAF